MSTTVLAGGVGAARFLVGLLAVVEPTEITAIVNVGDDFVLNGLSISPDLDTVTYTLAGAVNPDTGWGLVGETWQAMNLLRTLGGEAWFNLGDRDLATHLFRTARLAGGGTLSEVAAALAKAWHLGLTLLPATDDRLQTRITLAEAAAPAERPGVHHEAGDEIGFQEYFVGLHHDVAVAGVRFDGAQASRPAPGVLAALTDPAVTRIVVAPSNPLVSIAPLLAVPGIREAVTARRDAVVAVSPIVAGSALKGPADRLLVELGHESSVVGVARLYAPFASVLVVDEADAASADAVEAEGMRCVVAPTIMSDPTAAAALAKVVLAC